MRSRTVRKWALPPALLLGIGAAAGLVGAASAAWAQATGRPAAAEPPARAISPDETAIRALDDAFVQEYSKGDSKALAAHFTEDAEVVEANGDRYEGRTVIERSFADTFNASKGAKIAFEIQAIRLLSPDAAKEEGRSVVSPATGAPVSRRYTVLYVKRGGAWLIASVREEDEPLLVPHDRLKDLEWMAGDWVDEGSDAVVHVHCAWSDDQNFLIRSFTVKRAGKPVLSVTQRIGWDPQAKQIRSWEFDSEGGFGEGRWSRDGERWIVKHSGVRPDGATASATNFMVRERSDLIRWLSTDRVVGDEPVADDIAYVLVRVPPAPAQTKLGASPASTTIPNNTRSPR